MENLLPVAKIVSDLAKSSLSPKNYHITMMVVGITITVAFYISYRKL